MIGARRHLFEGHDHPATVQFAHGWAARNAPGEPVTPLGLATSYGSGLARGLATIEDAADPVRGLGKTIDSLAKVGGWAKSKLGLITPQEGDRDVAVEQAFRRGTPLETNQEMLERSGMLHNPRNGPERWAHELGEFTPNAFAPGGPVRAAARVAAPVLLGNAFEGGARAAGAPRWAQSGAHLAGNLVGGVADHFANAAPGAIRPSAAPLPQLEGPPARLMLEGPPTHRLLEGPPAHKLLEGPPTLLRLPAPQHPSGAGPAGIPRDEAPPTPEGAGQAAAARRRGATPAASIMAPTAGARPDIRLAASRDPAAERATAITPDDEFAVRFRNRLDDPYKLTSKQDDTLFSIASQIFLGRILNNRTFSGFTDYDIEDIQSRLAEAAEQYRQQGKSGGRLADHLDGLRDDFAAMVDRERSKGAPSEDGNGADLIDFSQYQHMSDRFIRPRRPELALTPKTAKLTVVGDSYRPSAAPPKPRTAAQDAAELAKFRAMWNRVDPKDRPEAIKQLRALIPNIDKLNLPGADVDPDIPPFEPKRTTIVSNSVPPQPDVKLAELAALGRATANDNQGPKKIAWPDPSNVPDNAYALVPDRVPVLKWNTPEPWRVPTADQMANTQNSAANDNDPPKPRGGGPGKPPNAGLRRAASVLAAFAAPTLVPQPTAPPSGGNAMAPGGRKAPPGPPWAAPTVQPDAP
jgi:hypothetical protein